MDNISISIRQQDEEEEASTREPSPLTKSTLDDPQRQCIIEFVDDMSPSSEEPQHHIANISYQQHPCISPSSWRAKFHFTYVP